MYCRVQNPSTTRGVALSFNRGRRSDAYGIVSKDAPVAPTPGLDENGRGSHFHELQGMDPPEVDGCANDSRPPNMSSFREVVGGNMSSFREVVGGPGALPDQGIGGDRCAGDTGPWKQWNEKGLAPNWLQNGVPPGGKAGMGFHSRSRRPISGGLPA
jgi:hypothetical protein